MGKIRDYQYISDSKLEVLFPQIPTRVLDGLSAEIGVDFGLLNAKILGQPPPLESRVSKLIAVERYLHEQNLLKSTILPQTWVSGKFVARAGYLPPNKGLILFAGRQNKSAIILAGSESNLVSGSMNPGADKGWSFMPRLLASLERYVQNHYDLLDVEKDLTKEGDLAEFTAKSYIFGGRITGSAHEALYELDKRLPEPSLLIYFIARIFIVGTNLQDESVAVGSPLAAWTE